MSEARTVLAPGKIVLAGEYAVLDGGPALVMAIDRGVRCELQPGGPGLRIETPDGDDRFVRPALEGAPDGLYRFSAWNPVDLPGKAGFGGSAAACVAACLAAGRPALDALALHRQVQGSGSGIDVLASVHGGTLLLRGATLASARVRPPRVVYSGAPARTGPRVAQYLGWTDALARQGFVERCGELVEELGQDPIGVTAALAGELRAMARQAGVAWSTPALDRIMDLARARGGAARPSGAGG